MLTKLLGPNWMHLTVRVRGIGALSLPIAALILNSLLIFPLYLAQQTASDWISHTFQIRFLLQEIVAELSNVTVNYRMYRLSKDPGALRAAELGASEVREDVDRVRMLTSDNLRQQTRIPELRMLVDRRIEFLRDSALLAAAPPEKELSNQMLRRSLVSLLNRMDLEEMALLATRQQTQRRTRVFQIAAEVTALCVGIVSGLLGILWFTQIEAGIRRMTDVLEERVAERTWQLAEANGELEAFSSSVSHDLRAPLRSVDGFARILLRDYSAQLDAKGQDMIRRMRAATLRMAQLIEDLLKLARLSRSEIDRQQADLSALAAAVCDDLRASHPERGVDVQIEAGLCAQADPRLVRVVLENLLGNAWKFTRNVPAAKIHFGSEADPVEGSHFYVRDNGAGFNMEAASQLFAPFQRLHSASEYEGSGVGLATVQRVIHRHRGRIWANASPGKGATFSFTLDDQNKDG